MRCCSNSVSCNHSRRCRPIRNLTQMRGYDITTHTLACFGGAGPQHACAMAKALGMSKVFVHRYGGILSAYGLSMADAVHEEQVRLFVVRSQWDVFNCCSGTTFLTKFLK